MPHRGLPQASQWNVAKLRFEPQSSLAPEFNSYYPLSSAESAALSEPSGTAGLQVEVSTPRWGPPTAPYCTSPTTLHSK